MRCRGLHFAKSPCSRQSFAAMLYILIYEAFKPIFWRTGQCQLIWMLTHTRLTSHQSSASLQAGDLLPQPLRQFGFYLSNCLILQLRNVRTRRNSLFPNAIIHQVMNPEPRENSTTYFRPLLWIVAQLILQIHSIHWFCTNKAEVLGFWSRVFLIGRLASLSAMFGVVI
jgi:hypothetical protein